MKRLLAIISLVLIIYFPTLFGYFQHDEWSTFGSLILYQRAGMSTIVKYLFWPDIAHYTPITRLAYFLEFVFFKLNFLPYILFSISLHLIVVYLFYQLIKQITKSVNFSIAAAIVFILSLAGFQAVTWVGASTVTLLSVIFALLSFRYYIKNKTLWWIVFWFLSMLSKETAIAMPVVFVAYSFIFENKLRIYKPFVCLFLYVVMRGLFFLFPNPGGTTYVATQTQSILQIAYNLASFPIKIYSQSIIPQESLISLTRSLSFLIGIKSEIIIETYGVEVASTVIFISSLFMIFHLRKKITSKYFKIIEFGIVFALLNSFIYALSPGRTGIITLVDSRNLYFPMIGISMVLTSIFYFIYKQKKIYGYLFLILLMFLNLPIVFGSFRQIADTGISRRKTVNEIVNSHPSLPNKSIFYVESDKAYYGMAEENKIPPFETGLGQILLVDFNYVNNFPDNFFKDEFLYGILDQGYREGISSENNMEVGFGYFRDYDKLAGEIMKDKLASNTIFAYRWKSGANELIDITNEVRAKIDKSIKK